MLRTSNPALNSKVFNVPAVGQEVMTIQGTVNKSFILLAILIFAASLTWGMFFKSPASVGAFILLGALGGFIVGLITIFKKTWAPVTAPVYCFLEGLLLGALSAMFEKQFSGIVFQAVLLTFGTLFSLLMAYKSGLIKATENFKLGVVAATGGIFVVYLVSIVLSFFGVHMGMIYGNGIIGIGFSLFVVVIAALNLVLDFDFIEKGAQMQAPQYMEWYAAFGLMVTLIWLYIEILRLLAKLNSRR